MVMRIVKIRTHPSTITTKNFHRSYKHNIIQNGSQYKIHQKQINFPQTIPSIERRISNMPVDHQSSPSLTAAEI